VFGIGCPGSVGFPSLTANSLPWIGDHLALEASNLAATVALVALVGGLSDQAWSGVWSLPHPLAVVGMPGCVQFVSVDVVSVMAPSGTTATFSLPVPNQPALLGVTLFHQAAVFESGANAAGIVVSNATRSVIGGR
jgi:hypothetical protein